MFLCYCTNIWNHHQGPVATALAEVYGPEDFRLALYQPLDHPYSLNRIRMGWNLHPPAERWILGPPAMCADVDYSPYAALARDAEVLIYNGSVPYVTPELLLWRKRHGKLSMRMGERFYKVPLSLRERLSPQKIVGRMISRLRLERAGVHFLTMGHGCVEDLNVLHACRGRIWRWGYLTAVSAQCCEKADRDFVHVGWCGRLIDWKRVDLLVAAVGMLSPEAKRRCRVTILGDGDQEGALRGQSARLGIDGIVTFRPSVSSAEAAAFMRDLDVYVFPSNRMEGWGAALLEAMDKGCAVVANEAAGSTLEVVRNGENGFVFRDGDAADLTRCLERLVMDRALRQAFGKRAWDTVQSWSPACGAARLSALLDALRSGNMRDVPKAGLCARVG